jgi:hypothetical protein
MRVGYKPTIPVFERTKTFRALNRAATVTGSKPSIFYHAYFKAISKNSLKRLKLNFANTSFWLPLTPLEKWLPPLGKNPVGARGGCL